MKNKVIGIGLSVIGVLGVVFAGVSPVAAAGATAEGSEHGGPGEWNEELNSILRDSMKGAVAATLGISVEEVEAAFDEGTHLSELAEQYGVDMETLVDAIDAARAEAIADALAQGLITADQAERLAQVSLRHLHEGAQHLLDEYGPFIEIDREAIREAVAGALGMTVEAFETAREADTSLEAMAEEAGVDMAVIREAAQAAHLEAINTALADGIITAEQAESLLERVENREAFSDVRETLRERIAEVIQNLFGVSTSDLRAAHQDGTSFDDLLEEYGIAREDLVSALNAAQEEVINGAVADGTLTQEQGTSFLERSTRNPLRALIQRARGGRPGVHGEQNQP